MVSLRPATATDHDLAVFLARQLGEASQSLLAAHQFNPRLLPGMIQIAEQQGGIAACALVRPMRTQIGAAILECALLTVVPSELPADLLEALVAACLPALADSGAILLLTHGSMHSMAPLGMATYHHQIQSLLPRRSPAPIPGLRPATSADTADIAALYDASYRRLPYAELRSPADWRSWPLSGLVYVQADRLGRISGYLLIIGDLVAEAGAFDAGAARGLLNALTAELHVYQLTLPVAHPITQVALQLGAEVSLRAATTSEPASLAGVLDLAGILGQLLPELEQRLAASRYRGWSGTVGIALEHGPTALHFTQGAASVLDAPRACDLWLRRVSLAGLAQLVLGYRSPADLRATGELACDDTALGLLDALFPIIG